ncbi:MAG: hypothetical protein PHH98_02115 [Candidatus Gracilibacteria bacterium]|nr:hypothetical protein [Candidatus Gracilibacteria bacterium]
MIPTKIILTSNKKILEIAISKYNLVNIKNENDLLVYEGIVLNEEENEKIVFIKIDNKNLDLVFVHIEENYIYEKIINIDDGKVFLNFELKIGDIVIPNTFIDINDQDKAFFIDTVVGENYDLVKFGLILNGICLSVGNKKIDELEGIKEDFYADIVDVNSFDLIQRNKLLNNDSIFSAIKVVVGEEDDFLEEYYINALNILDLIY